MSRQRCRSLGWSPDRPSRLAAEPPTLAPGERRVVVQLGGGLSTGEAVAALEHVARLLRATDRELRA